MAMHLLKQADSEDIPYRVGSTYRLTGLPSGGCSLVDQTHVQAQGLNHFNAVILTSKA
jgi:hypothetical protein